MVTKQQKYLLSIVPLTRIPLTRDQAFFYTATKPVSFGALVEIPIGKRSMHGIVIACKKDFSRVGGMELKPVGTVLEPSFVTKKQYHIAEFISTYYFTSLGIVLKHFTPGRVSPRTKERYVDVSQTKLPALPRAEQQILATIHKSYSRGQSVHLLQTTHNAFALEFIVHVVHAAYITAPTQILIVVPEHALIPLYKNLFSAYFPAKDIVLLTSTLTKGHFYKNWERVRSGRARIILGTRAALFAPFKNIGLVMVAESHDIAHKQWDMHPRYDVRTVARELAHLYGAHFLSHSTSPRIADVQSALEDNTLVALPATNRPRITIVDMKKEYWQQNEKRHTKKRPLLSETLLTAIKNTFHNGQQALLFINHQGKNAFSVCASCKAVLRCETCERALVERSSGAHSCLHCNFTTAIFPTCIACGGMTFRSVGLGTEQLEEALAKILPRARIARVDSASMKKARAYEDLYQDFHDGTIDILIGTQMATKGWQVPNLTLAAIIDMDQLLGGTDYDTDERAYAHILQLGSRVGIHGTLIVQAFDTLHPVLQAATKNNWPAFMEEEIDMRRILHFPPFARIIKIVYQASDKNHVEQEVETLYNELTTLCAHHDDIIISEPHDPIINKVRTHYRRQIIIKMKTPKLTKKYTLPKVLHDKLITMGNHWIIDRDPVNFT